MMKKFYKRNIENKFLLKYFFHFHYLLLLEERLRNKIKFVSRMMMINKTLREERENVMKLKGVVIKFFINFF